MRGVGCVKDGHATAVLLQEGHHVVQDLLLALVADVVGGLVARVEPLRVRDGSELLTSVIGLAVDAHGHCVEELKIPAQPTGNMGLATS